VAASNLLTERLVLIPLGPGDLDEVAALYGDPEVMRHIDGGIRTRAATADALAAAERNWERRGWGLWAIRDATTGGLVGEGGLQPLDDVNGAAIDFGFTLGRRHWGKGLATEAGAAILADAWDRYDGDQLQAIAHTDNGPSKAVLKKLGFHHLDNRTVDEEIQEIWALDRPA
jgi:RimJ/RimL family protein N-acetyltransferase